MALQAIGRALRIGQTRRVTVTKVGTEWPCHTVLTLLRCCVGFVAVPAAQHARGEAAPAARDDPRRGKGEPFTCPQLKFVALTLGFLLFLFQLAIYSDRGETRPAKIPKLNQVLQVSGDAGMGHSL